MWHCYYHATDFKKIFAWQETSWRRGRKLKHLCSPELFLSKLKNLAGFLLCNRLGDRCLFLYGGFLKWWFLLKWSFWGVFAGTTIWGNTHIFNVIIHFLLLVMIHHASTFFYFLFGIHSWCLANDSEAESETVEMFETRGTSQMKQPKVILCSKSCSSHFGVAQPHIGTSNPYQKPIY